MRSEVNELFSLIPDCLDDGCIIFGAVLEAGYVMGFDSRLKRKKRGRSPNSHADDPVSYP